MVITISWKSSVVFVLHTHNEYFEEYVPPRGGGYVILIGSRPIPLGDRLALTLSLPPPLAGTRSIWS